MRKRVTHEEDYLSELAESIAHERAKDPRAALPWEWWREQAARFGVTPNNIYSRAVKHGIYTPPRRKAAGSRTETSGTATAPESGTGRQKRQSAPGDGQSRTAPPETGQNASDSENEARSKVNTPVRPGGTAAPSSRLLSERLHAMAEIADVIGEMEERIRTLERERDTEAAKTREAVRALDRLARVLEEASGTVSALRQLYEG